LRHAETAASASRRMQKQFGDLLVVAGVDTGTLVVRPTRVHPVELARQLTRSTSELGVEPPAVAVEPDVPFVLGDVPRLVQAFGSLLETARSFMKTGNLTLRAATTDGMVQ